MDLALSLETPIIRESREIQSDLKWTLAKLCQETQENPIVSIALLPMWLAPKDKLKLSTFELRCGRSIPQAREKGYLNSLEMEQLSMPFR